MALSISCKKTTDISDSEISEIYDLFFTIFEKRRPTSLFRQQFENTTRRYSYHALAKDGDKIVGHNVYIPFDYIFEGRLFPIALSVDAMVHPDYRGRGIYENLAIACEETAKNDGCKLRIGFPNENSYPIQMRKFHYTHIGELTTYCLPIKIGAFKPILKYLNWGSALISKVLLFCGKFNYSNNRINAKIMPLRPEYDFYRFKWFDGKYEIIKDNNFNIVYKLDNFKGVKAAFILDVYPLTKNNFEKAVKMVYDNVKSIVPFILYVGNLPFTPFSMIKIPERFAPKHFHVVGKALSNEIPGDGWKELRNWNLNLASFDLL